MIPSYLMTDEREIRSHTSGRDSYSQLVYERDEWIRRIPGAILKSD